MKDQKHTVDYISVRWFNDRGDEINSRDVRSRIDAERMRLSIVIDALDSHHIEIRPGEDRYRLAGLLHRLAQSVAEGDLGIMDKLTVERVTFPPKGEPMPKTPDQFKRMGDLYEKALIEEKAENARLRELLHKAQAKIQKLRKQIKMRP